MSAPIGNQNARKAKIWEQAIKRALARKANSTVDNGLDLLADQIVAQAAAGEAWALKEVGDRLDGKPAQSIGGDPDGDPIRTLSEIVIRAVDATDG
jgi:hypothetical protein